MMRRLHLLLLFALGLFSSLAAAAPAIDAARTAAYPIGRHVTYLQETHSPLTLAQAIDAYRHGRFSASHRPVFTFGIGVRPVWLHFRVDNRGPRPAPLRLSIDTPWLDKVDVYFRHDGKTTNAYHVGDRKPFDLRPIRSRYFAFAHAFASGRNDVFIRVQTPDPMVIPLYLTTLPQAEALERGEDYSYGFLYGFLLALLAYNLMLYIGLRAPRYALYALYLGMFMLMNFSYTGHGFALLWPSHTGWAQWSQPTLMMLYASSGLLFALSFLETRRHFPRLHLAVQSYIGAGTGLLLLTLLFDSQREALLLAFSYVFLFTAIMLAMAVIAVRAGQKAARYFLFASVSAMLGAAVTALAVWGFIPFSLWTFRAVDLGMLLDATLLALALTYQFRLGQTQREQAMRLSRIDPLTGVNNRRALFELSAPLWSSARRHDRDLSVILLDLDHFKRINDTYGHACGDAILKMTARMMEQCVREHDLIARWGGEEFLLLLPETSLEQATALAERLRQAIAGNRLNFRGEAIAITASLGVAQRESRHTGIEELISIADKRLYRAKADGRNRVNAEAPDLTSRGTDMV